MDIGHAKAVHAQDRKARLLQEVSLPKAARTLLRFDGTPISVRFAQKLTAHRGILLSGSDRGQPVHAGAFLRKREIVLDSSLRKNRGELARILVHELFHFVWLRLGNPGRAAWRSILKMEADANARGELGWSSEWRKRESTPDYACESFCDTAAWMYSGIATHDEFTLAAKWRLKRRVWFELRFHNGRITRV